MDAPFAAGESIEWSAREGNTLTKRAVRFERLDGPDAAVVAWGLRSDGTGEPHRFTAPLAELARPQPAPRPWYVPPPAVPQPPFRPPSAEQTASRLADRRATLRAAHQKAARARDVVAAATEVANRARRECDAARSALASLDTLDAESLRALEDALRTGRAPEPIKNGIDRAAIRHRCDIAEAAHARFDRELATANVALGEALAAVRAAAAAVVAGIVEREAEALRDIEAQAATRRAQLSAAAHWWPDAGGPLRLAPAPATLIANPPGPVPEPVGPAMRAAGIAAHTVPWRALYERLVQGVAEADFKFGNGPESSGS